MTFSFLFNGRVISVHTVVGGPSFAEVVVEEVNAPEEQPTNEATE